MVYSKAISKRKVALLAGLALVASLFFGLSRAAQAQPTCTLTGPTVSPSPTITGGSQIVFGVKCQAGAERTVRTEVAADEILVLKDVETVGANAGANLQAVKDIFVAPQKIKVCVGVDGEVPQQCVEA